MWSVERSEGLRLRRGRHAGDVQVALVLTAHVVGRIRVGDRAEDLLLLVAQGLGVDVGGGLHGDQRQHLEQVVLHDVTQRAHRVVERAPVLDTEVLGHRDLHRLHVSAVPERLEDRVREPQEHDVHHGFLAREVVDPEQLRFFDQPSQRGVELAGRRQVVTERLLDHDASRIGQPGAVQTFHDAGEQRWRDLQVERGALRRRPGDRRACRTSGRRHSRRPRRTCAPRADRRPCHRRSRPPPRSTSAHARAARRRSASSIATPTIGHESWPRRSSR